MTDAPLASLAPLVPLARDWTRIVGWRAPRAFDRPDEERRRLDEAAVAVLPWRGVVRMTGADRERFLNGYLTADVKGLAAGASVYGFFTDRQGRVLADATVMAWDDGYRLDLPRGAREAVVEHLSRYLIADRVELDPADEEAVVLFGRAADAVAGAASHPGGVAGVSWPGGEGVAVRRGVAGVPALVVWAPPQAAAHLVEAALAAGHPPVGSALLDRARVERGIPRFGQDYGPEHFPQETGREAEAVSYTKGCYLGQEVVARIHYRGGVNRGLRAVKVTADVEVPPNAEIALDGRSLGRLTTWAPSPDGRGGTGLAVLHRRGAEPGTRVTIEGGSEGEVLALPARP